MYTTKHKPMEMPMSPAKGPMASDSPFHLYSVYSKY